MFHPCDRAASACQVTQCLTDRIDSQSQQRWKDPSVWRWRILVLRQRPAKDVDEPKEGDQGSARYIDESPQTRPVAAALSSIAPAGVKLGDQPGGGAREIDVCHSGRRVEVEFESTLVQRIVQLDFDLEPVR